MTKRSRQTPLYEFMADQSDSVQRAHKRQKRSRAHESEAEPVENFSLEAGRSIRLPVGAVLLAVAAAIILIIAAYIVGSWRAGAAAKADYEQRILEASEGLRNGGPMSDPLIVPNTPTDEPEYQPVAPEPAPIGSDPGAAASDRGWEPVESDPRVAGLNYLIVAETRPDGAVRLAAFCREQGLAAYVVSGNNDRFRRVIVLPGFPSRSKAEPAAQSLLEEIYRIGALWKSRNRGESDLRDAYFPP